MRKILNLIVIIFLLSLSIGCSREDKLKELTKEEKVEDFNHYVNTMTENYCNFDVFYNKYKTEYLDLYEVFKGEIENSNDNKEFYNIMSASINLLGDGHTNLIEPDQVDWYRDAYKGQYQGEVLNDEELVDKNKKWENYLAQNDNLQSLHKKINEKISKNYNKENIETKIIDNEIAYLKINSFMEFTKEDIDKINELYKDINNYNDYIIDIRNNGGGNNQLWMEYIVNPIVNDTYESTTYELHKEGRITKDYYASRGKSLKDINEFPNKDILKNVRNIDDYKYYNEYNLKFTNESIWEGEGKTGYNGNIYLLVNEGVFSSSEGLAVFCKNSGWAKVVGNENSGGDGTGIDPIVFTLPNSGLVVRTTTGKGLNKDGSSNLENGTSLDLYMNSLDDLIEYIKNKN